MVSFLSATVCSSRVMGHCNQYDNNSSVYPIRKYIFRAVIPRRIIAATRMWLCCRLIITSEQTRSWKVPVRNRRMKMSSTAVSAVRRPSRIVAEKSFRMKFQVKIGKLPLNLTGIPGVPRLPVVNEVRGIGHLVGQWPVALWCDSIPSGLNFVEGRRKMNQSLLALLSQQSLVQHLKGYTETQRLSPIARHSHSLIHL